MGFRKSLWRLRALAFLAAMPVAAQEIPAGTEISVRLTTKVSTQESHAEDPVEAVVISPVVLDARIAIPAGSTARGTVSKVVAPKDPDGRGVVSLEFKELEAGGRKLAMAARVGSIDNAREHLNEKGEITGILASETVSERLDAGITKVAQNYSGLADILGAVKNIVVQPTKTDIVYAPGVEMTLRLSEPLALPENAAMEAGVPAPGIADRDTLAELVAREPFQTVAQKPPLPSDITNLMLIGDEADLKKAFADAGWRAAATLSARSKFETLRALAEDRGYEEAPVSILMLEGRPPDMVFEKTNNTFAKRHHLRVWRRPAMFQGKQVWAVAATHDVGINFSEKDRTFIHRVDSQIDRERAKVTDDLMFAGHVAGIEMVERPQAPKEGKNATGDTLSTDGKIAVLMLK
jgi:hypothetical protein